MTARDTLNAVVESDELLRELLRLRKAGALFESDLQRAVWRAFDLAEYLPEDMGDRLVSALDAWLADFRRAQALRGTEAAAQEAARRVIDAAASRGKGGAR